ncbi:MAG: type II toxin-antitoxin system Phd/YefM family antitoxin [Planctomycetota bacterium]
MSQKSVADAKAHFNACLREVERGEPVTVMRHGKPVAVIVSAEAWERRQVVERTAGKTAADLVADMRERIGADDGRGGGRSSLVSRHGLVILMVMSQRSVADAKAHFSACLREAERGEPVTVVRHGKPVAVIVSAEAWERRQGAERNAGKTAADLVAAMRERIGEADGEALYEAGMAIYRSRERRPHNRPLPEDTD